MTFPELCHRQLGIVLPKEPEDISIESWLLCISMQDMACFGPYSYSHDFVAEILKSAQEMWSSYQKLQKDFSGLNKIPYAKGYNPLCSFCQSALDCPKFYSLDAAKEWDSSIASLMKLKEQKSCLEEQIRAMEEDLKKLAENIGKAGWLDTGSYRFRLAKTAGRRILDKQLLLSELADLFSEAGLSSINPESLIASCEKLSSPSSRLQVMKV